MTTRPKSWLAAAFAAAAGPLQAQVPQQGTDLAPEPAGQVKRSST